MRTMDCDANCGLRMVTKIPHVDSVFHTFHLKLYLDHPCYSTVNMELKHRTVTLGRP